MIEIVLRRSTVYAAFSIALGTVAALAACELAARLAAPRIEPIFVVDHSRLHSADCYSRAPGVSFPLDLAREKDRQEFVSWFGSVTDAMAMSQKRKSQVAGLEHRLDPATAAAALEQVLPLCVTYDRQPDSSRYHVPSPGAKQTLALMGDSFVFGHGVAAESTFSAQLARELKVNVVSYAQNGVNMPEIEREFDLAMKEARRAGFSRIAYVYVLNDTYVSPELGARLNKPPEPSPWRDALNSFSVLAQRLTLAATQRRVSAETLRWYVDAHDPALNEGLIRTMQKIASWTRESRKRGIDFVVLVYPMMFDMESYPLADVHRHLRELAGQYGVELHDLLPAFEARGRGANLIVHPQDRHPNAFAQSLAARDAAAYLRGR